MKLRRAIPAIIVLAGILMLLLGILGVFSSSPRLKPSPATEGSDTGSLGTQMQIVSRGFRVEDEGWSLYADEARTAAGEDLELVGPLLHFTQPGKEGADEVEVSADRGKYVKQPEQRVSMSGNVRVQAKGNTDALLKAESLEVEPESNSGRSDGMVAIEYAMEEGIQKAQGRGVEFKFEDRVVVIQNDIRMEIVGHSMLPDSSESGATPITLLTCDGPARADGFKRSVEFRNNVVLRQGDNSLRSDLLTVEMAADTQALERFVAEGNIQIQAQGAEGNAEKLSRTAMDDLIVLEGSPASLKQGGGRIQAYRIEMALTDSAILVPGEGSLEFASENPEEPPVNISWNRMLRFSSEKHEALFSGDVRFVRGEQSIDCQRLVVKLDSENKGIVQCRADDDVRLAARVGERVADASGDSLIYDPSGRIALVGHAEVNLTEGKITGDRIEFDQPNQSIRVIGAGKLEGKPATAETQAISASWSGGMSFASASRVFTFERDVLLDSGGRILRAGRVVGTMNEDKVLTGFSAFDDVDLREKLPDGAERLMSAAEINTEMGEDGKPKTMIAMGNARIEQRPLEGKPMSLEADMIRAAMRENSLEKLNADGNVVVTGSQEGSDYVMHADALQAEVDTDGVISEFEATGRRVTIQQSEGLAEGSRLVWNLKENTGTLFGSPVVFSQGRNRLIGDRIEFLRDNGSIRVTSDTGRVEATIIRSGVGNMQWPF